MLMYMISIFNVTNIFMYVTFIKYSYNFMHYLPSFYTTPTTKSYLEEIALTDNTSFCFYFSSNVCNFCVL